MILKIEIQCRDRSNVLSFPNINFTTLTSRYCREERNISLCFFFFNTETFEHKYILLNKFIWRLKTVSISRAELKYSFCNLISRQHGRFDNSIFEHLEKKMLFGGIFLFHKLFQLIWQTKLHITRVGDNINTVPYLQVTNWLKILQKSYQRYQKRPTTVVRQYTWKVLL